MSRWTDRDRERGHRPRAVAAKTIRTDRTPKYALRLVREETAAILSELGDVGRPVTRGECAGGERPCPFVSCTHHLYFDVSPKTGAIKLNFPDLEPDEMQESCALDVADRGGATLEQVGAVMNLTRERIRQYEARATSKVKASEGATALREHLK